jgi:hypothetical protein
VTRPVAPTDDVVRFDHRTGADVDFAQVSVIRDQSESVVEHDGVSQEEQTLGESDATAGDLRLAGGSVGGIGSRS